MDGWSEVISVVWAISTSEDFLSKGPLAKRETAFDPSDVAEPEERDERCEVSEVREWAETAEPSECAEVTECSDLLDSAEPADTSDRSDFSDSQSDSDSKTLRDFLLFCFFFESVFLKFFFVFWIKDDYSGQIYRIQKGLFFN